jgi:hypothetical protein
MAIDTVPGGSDMRRGFANGLNAVVTRSAIALDPAMVEFDARPLCGRVTGVAALLSAGVLGRHSRGPDRIVATGAIARCPGENTIFVAGFAANRAVRAIEGVAGFVVIEVASYGDRPGLCVRRRARHENRSEQYQQH